MNGEHAPVAKAGSTPPLVFTVAITGHQDIPPALHAALERQVQAVLGQAREVLLSRSAASPLDRQREVSLRFVSALAPGADQIGARAVCDHACRAEGWRLEAILPFALPVCQQLARETLAARNRDKAADEARLASEDVEAAIGAMAALAQAADRVLELDDWQAGPADAVRADRTARRFATIGRMLVRRADLLIAIWDGLPPRGRGGTADVVGEARHSGLPVVWIDPADPQRLRSIVPDPATATLSASELAAVARPAGGQDAAGSPAGGGMQAVDCAVDQVLLGDDPARATCIARYLDESPAQRWIAGASAGRPTVTSEPGDSFGAYAQMLYLFLRWPRRAMRALSPEERAAGKAPEPLRHYPFRLALLEGTRLVWRQVLLSPFDFGVARDAPGTANAQALLAHAERADALATRLSNQYRSAYVLIFALAPVAVGFAVTSAMFPAWKPAFVVFELAAVSLAAGIFLRTRDDDPVAPKRTPRWWRRPLPRSQDTHQRWLDARLIAESQRSGQLLAWAGFSGRRPIEDDRGAADDSHWQHPAAHGHAKPERTVWAPYFANAIAALPELPHDGDSTNARTSMTPARIASLAAAAGRVIEHQRAYHDLNHQRLETLNHRLDNFSLWAIGIAFLFSASYLALFGVTKLHLSGILGEALHGLYVAFKSSAAFFGAFLPAVAAAAAGIRFQGDFERFAMRSKDTAKRLGTLAARASRIEAEAGARSAAPGGDGPPLFEQLLDLLLDTQSVLDEDLADWRFAYAARPITFG